MTRLLAVMALLSATSAASADCLFATTQCSEDQYGNTYRTEQNLGSGYTTYRNGSRYSTTDQNLGGTWTERYESGGYTHHNYNPYRPLLNNTYDPYAPSDDYR